jgi:hypothetical protein
VGKVRVVAVADQGAVKKKKIALVSFDSTVPDFLLVAASESRYKNAPVYCQ